MGPSSQPSPPSPRPAADPAPTSSSLVSIGPLGSSGEPESAKHILEPCHIDRLPTEVLVSILSHLPPPTIRLTNPPRVDNAPLTISLVSRRFHAVGRDYLWRGCAVVAEVTSTSHARAAAVLRNVPCLTHDCRELELLLDTDHDADWTGSWATLFPSIQRLTLEDVPRFDLAEAAQFRGLRHLSISNVMVVLKTDIVFPRLESVHLDMDLLVPRQPFFNKRSFPALRRILVAHSNIEPLIAQNEVVFPIDFLAQLDYVEIAGYGDDTAYYARLLPVEQLVCRTPILWRLDLIVDRARGAGFLALARSSFLHAHFLILDPIRTYFNKTDKLAWTERVLVEMRIVLAPPSHPHLRLVLVPAYLWHPSPHNTTAANEAARRAVEDVCARRGVVLRTYAARRTENAGAVPEFLAFLREEAARGEERS
ncbi:hypothetical protein JCM3775_003702 [Rhodotorula graminis]